METNTSLPVREHHVHQRHFDRLVMLADGVFAIALTLSAVELRPEAKPGETLLQVWGLPLLAYFMSFFIIGTIWMQHRRTMAHLRRVDRPLTLITLLLLSLVALVPVVIRVMVSAGGGMTSTQGIVVYAMSVIAIQLCLGVGWGYAAFVAGLAPDVPRARAWGWLARDLFVILLWCAIICYFRHAIWAAALLLAASVAARALVLRLERRAGPSPG